MRPSLRTAAYLAVILAALSVVLHEMGGTARATGNLTVVVGMMGEANEVIASDGGIYVNPSGDRQHYQRIGSIGPLTSPPVTGQTRASNVFEVILESGDIVVWNNGQVQLVGNVFSGPATAVESSTWSAIKGRFGH